MTLPTLLLLTTLTFPSQSLCLQHIAERVQLRVESKGSEVHSYSISKGTTVIEYLGAHAVLECSDGKYKAYILEDK